MLIGQPSTRRLEVEIQMPHHQVDRAALSSAHEAMVDILADTIRQAWVLVVMKRAEALVPPDPESKSLCDPLYREVAKLLKFKLIHFFLTLNSIKVFLRLAVESRLLRVRNELSEHPLA